MNKFEHYTALFKVSVFNVLIYFKSWSSKKKDTVVKKGFVLVL